MSRGMLAGLFLLVGVSAGCEKPRGACEVAYDMFGTKGDACTVDREDSCKDPVSPGIGMATTTVKKFTPNAACDTLGYKKGGCADIAIAWSFKDKCPR